MVKHRQIATEIQRLIRRRRLRPGDSIPSERDLAKRFRVSYNTIRYANDLLCRQGLIDRHHGRGTFLAHSPRKSSCKTHRRLGLLYVDLAHPLHPYSQQLTFAIQRTALRAGYELIIEEMRTEELLQGKVPEMVRRRSVDALLLDGRVRDHHIRFLEDHSVLYLVLGNRPLGADVPQLRINVENLAYEITRELFQAGRRPIWFDADPAKADLWYVDLERFRGYANAVKAFAPVGSLHLCPIEPDKVAQAAAMLCRSGLPNAAIVVDHWASAMLPAALAMHSPTPQEILIVPMPGRMLCQALSGRNVVTWSKYVEVDEVAEQALGSLVPLIEGRSEQLHSVSMEMKCRLLTPDPAPRMELTTSWEQKDAFSAEQYGDGRMWRHQRPAGPTPGEPGKVEEQVNAWS